LIEKEDKDQGQGGQKRLAKASEDSDEDLRTVMKDPNNGTIIKNDEFRLKDRKSGKHLY